jgi:hypothetical protein
MCYDPLMRVLHVCYSVTFTAKPGIAKRAANVHNNFIVSKMKDGASKWL